MNNLNQLVPVQPNIIDGETVQTVNARELHSYLEVGRDFSSWIKDRVEKAGLEENLDYIVTTARSPIESSSPVLGGGNSGLQGRIDYYLSFDAAKHISMMQNNPKGKAIRRYFIECEKELKKQDIKKQLMLDVISSVSDPISHTMALAALNKAYIVPLEQEVQEARPKVAYHDAVLQTENSITVTQIASELGMSARVLNKLLEEKMVQRKVGGQWVLYQEHQGKGYTKPKTYLVEDHAYQSTQWTQEGRRFIHSLIEP